MHVESTYDGRHERWVTVTASLDEIKVVERELVHRHYSKTGASVTPYERDRAVALAVKAATSRAESIMTAIIEADARGEFSD